VGAEVVGLRDLPSALSMTWLGLVLPSLLAEPIALELRRRNTKSFIYLHAQIFAALSYVAAGMCLWIVRGWKVGEMEAHARRAEEKKRRESLRELELDQEGKGGLASGNPNTDQASSPVEMEVDLAASQAGWEIGGLVRRMWKWTIV
jgi:hypothetical protein